MMRPARLLGACHALNVGLCISPLGDWSRVGNGPYGQGLLQQEPSTPQQDPSIDNDSADSAVLFGRVPVYGHARLRGDDGAGASWMVMFPPSHTRQALLAICSALAPPASCAYVGHPATGIPFIRVISPEDPLRNAMEGPCTSEEPSPATMCSARYVEVDGATRLFASEYPRLVRQDARGAAGNASVPWGLDRLDGRSGLDTSFGVDATGEGVHIFHMDTGVAASLEDFEGRAYPAADFTQETFQECRSDDFECAADRNGHGTHTAGTIASKTYGVAKKALVHALKVLGDDGGGTWSGFISAIDWSLAYVAKHELHRGIISASLGGKGPAAVVEEAVNRATTQGVAVVVAAGNANMDACRELPAMVKKAITVGSTEFTDGYDVKSSFSNYGTCVDLFAPGSDIISLGLEPGQAMLGSGTSMATPHVTGVLALVLSKDPGLDAGKAKHLMKHMTTRGCIQKMKTKATDTKNRLLYYGTDENRLPCGGGDDSGGAGGRGAA